ncbi:hypothetical protein NBRC103581_00347 [Gluconobacter wancherniae NBRC 103581]|uniref:Uncharacterized protein n=1 Tax=Gluconobacter wancherniae NBRC 103581 TaxID=656744 RepID=A0A511B131_9PROT|nr:hypothetical protein NBRC103581_00347 [Gluconobacter wancherniae NBRC 103581]GEK93313.1 hypothetical protein GWA01_10830 [Gluconobacter wancherniae NBRC 103581]
MDDAPEFLELDVVLFMHEQALREYGGTHGLSKAKICCIARWAAQKTVGTMSKRRSRTSRLWRLPTLVALRVIIPSMMPTSRQPGVAAFFPFG